MIQTINGWTCLLKNRDSSIVKARVPYFLLFILFLIPAITASDILIWKGQYYTGTDFNKGTYVFNFSVYDSSTGGELCYSNATNLTTGYWGEWETEQYGVSSACNNVSEDYFLEININGTSQLPRRRLTIFNFLRKDANEIISGDITFNGTLRGASPLHIDDDLKVNSVFSEGDVVVSGNISGNFYYGEMYLYNHSDLINIISPEIWHNVTNFTEGHNNGFSFSNSTLTAVLRGIYRLEYNLISESDKDAIHYFAPVINNETQNNCRTAVFAIKKNSLNSASNSCYVRLNSSDVLSLKVSNYIDSEDIIIREANFNIFRIGN